MDPLHTTLQFAAFWSLFFLSPILSIQQQYGDDQAPQFPEHVHFNRSFILLNIQAV